jgi:coenzyme Q-binding protein COQ10
VKFRQVEQQLPWNTEQMFDLVADIERYHEFLPGWSHARITQRQGTSLTVRQAIVAGPVRLEFESHAELQRPERLRVHSSGGPFRRFLLDWQFRPGSGEGCVVRQAASIEMHSLLLELAGERLLELLTRDIFQRFHDRAVLLYGYPTAGSGPRLPP